ncbi:MAG: hypothetical protein KBS53_05055, partial [Bacteroidales bacterium]|nr:hypothetical protein [Candidatus Hennigimonas equi]
ATLLLLSAGTANSQEAFKHLSMGLDLATTGIGLEFSLPVVTNHLVLKAGYNYGNFKFPMGNTSLNFSGLSEDVNRYVDKANSYLAQIPEESSRLTGIPSSLELDADGKIKLGTGKIVMEYYPSKKSSFHINAGVYIGNPNIFSIDGGCPELWNAYSTNLAIAKRMAEVHPEFSSKVGSIPELKATVNGRTFQLKEPGNVNVGLRAAVARPYLGLGFGRSIPKTRCGFQFDFGAIYIGKLSVSSANEVSGASSVATQDNDVQKVLDTIGKICVYPQLSFRFICRLF